jgi:hypothetical protein
MQTYDKLYKEPEMLEWEISTSDIGIKQGGFSILILILTLLMYSAFFDKAGLPNIDDLMSIGMLLFLSPGIIIISGIVYSFLKNRSVNNSRSTFYRLDEKGVTKRNNNNVIEFYSWSDFECFYKISNANLLYSAVSVFFGDEFMLLKKGSSYWWPQYVKLKTNLNDSYVIESIISKHLPIRYFNMVEPEVQLEKYLIEKIGSVYYLLIFIGLLLVGALVVSSLNTVKTVDGTATKDSIIMFFIPVFLIIIGYLVTNDKIKNTFLVWFFVILIIIISLFPWIYFDSMNKILSFF